jgi:hypothetical protein
MLEKLEIMVAERVRELEILLVDLLVKKQTRAIKVETAWNDKTLKYNKELLKRIRQRH